MHGRDKETSVRAAAAILALLVSCPAVAAEAPVAAKPAPAGTAEPAAGPHARPGPMLAARTMGEDEN